MKFSLFKVVIIAAGYFISSVSLSQSEDNVVDKSKLGSMKNELEDPW